MTDEQIEAGLGTALRRIEASKALYELILEFKRGDFAYHWHNYNSDEKKELSAIMKKHLLRRIKEEALKADIKL